MLITIAGVLLIIGLFRLAAKLPRTLIKLLTASAACLISLNYQRRERRLAALSAEPLHEEHFQPWLRLRREQQLLNAMTRGALSATELATSHPAGTAWGFVLARRLSALTSA